MSAITAIYYLNKNPLSPQTMGQMNSCLKHRGGDGEKIWVDCNIGFGHQMRWTTEESLRETLPYKSENSKCVITCDARISNRSELISQLPFRKEECEITDSEIILAAYEKWGESCLASLIGDFVFVIWDPETKKLFCGRDTFGVKHFYYYYEPGKVFALASEIKALFTLGFITREINEESVGDYIVLNFEDKESTFFKNIKRLPCNHGLVITENSIRQWEYYLPDPKKEIRLKNHQEYQEAFREKFTEAVASNLRSAFPLGAMLSGGLDSSSIVCIASKYLAERGRPPIHSFSAVFPTVCKVDDKIDEMSFMQSVIKKTGCQPHFVNCDDQHPLKDIKTMMWHADHPVGVPNLYIHWESFKEIEKQKIRVLLDGFDGDSTVSHGYEDFAQFAKRRKLISLIKEAVLLNKQNPHPFHSFRNLVLKNALSYALPFNLIKVRNSLRIKKRKKSLKEFNDLQWKIIDSDFKEKYRLEERSKHYWNSTYPENSTYIENRWAGLTSGFFSTQLERAETSAQAFSIEMRYPFFDRRLVDFCIALPPGQRMHNGWTRGILRYALSGFLPEEVQWRTNKANLSGGAKLNLVKYGLSDLENLVSDKNTLLKAYINIENLKAIYQRFKEKPLSNFGDSFILSIILFLSEWLRENEAIDKS